MGGDQKMWSLPENPGWENTGKAAIGTPKSFKLECDIVIFILKGLCYQMEKRWETGQEWMLSEQLEDPHGVSVSYWPLGLGRY